METLYSNRDAFFLTIDGTDYKINEPIGWNKVELVIQRTEKHGLELEFPSKDIQLEFDLVPEPETGNQSKVLIDDEYALNGPDSDITITFGEYDGITLTPLTTRRIDLSKEYLKTLYRTRCKTAKDNFQTIVEAHYETPVNIDQTVTVFNETLNGPIVNKTPINLHSKAIKKTGEVVTASEEVTGTYDILPGPVVDPVGGDNLFILIDTVPDTFSRTAYLQLAFTDATKKGLLKNLNLPTGISIFDPRDVDKYAFQTEDFGRYKQVYIRAAFTIRARGANLGSGLEVSTYVRVGGKSLIIATEVFPYAQLTYSRFIVQEAILDLTSGIPEIRNAMLKNDPIYVFTKLQEVSTGNGLNSISIKSITTYDSDEKRSVFQLIADTFFKPSIADASILYNAIEYNMRCITNWEFAFKSDFYTSGVGKDRVITNGHRIRKSEEANKAPTINLNDAFNSLQMMDNIGECFEMDDMGVWQLRWEYITYFYANVQLLDLTQNTADYEEMNDEEAFASQYSFLYPRLTVREDNGANTIDEFNSELDLIPPLKRIKSKKTYKSEWRTSGYDSETIRRLVENPTESFQSDDDIFIYEYLDYLIDEDAKIIVEFQDNENTSQLFMYFRRDDFDELWKFASTIIISNDPEVVPQANLNGTWEYNPVNFKKVTTGNPPEPYIKVPAERISTPFTNISTLEVSGLTIQTNTIVAERNTNFSTLTGVIDPESVYNVRLHPLRCFVNHALMANAGLYYKDNSALYRTQFKKQNRDLETQRDVLDGKEAGDTSRALMQEGIGITKGNADGGRYLTIPTVAKFNAELNRAQILILMNAAQYEDMENGYITTLDNDGNPVDIWPDIVSGLPNSNWYEIIGRKKGNYYDV